MDNNRARGRGRGQSRGGRGRGNGPQRGRGRGRGGQQSQRVSNQNVSEPHSGTTRRVLKRDRSIFNNLPENVLENIALHLHRSDWRNMVLVNRLFFKAFTRPSFKFRGYKKVNGSFYLKEMLESKEKNFAVYEMVWNSATKFQELIAETCRNSLALGEINTRPYEVILSRFPKCEDKKKITSLINVQLHVVKQCSSVSTKLIELSKFGLTQTNNKKAKTLLDQLKSFLKTQVWACSVVPRGAEEYMIEVLTLFLRQAVFDDPDKDIPNHLKERLRSFLVWILDGSLGLSNQTIENIVHQAFTRLIQIPEAMLGTPRCYVFVEIVERYFLIRPGEELWIHWLSMAISQLNLKMVKFVVEHSSAIKFTEKFIHLFAESMLKLSCCFNATSAEFMEKVMDVFKTSFPEEHSPSFWKSLHKVASAHPKNFDGHNIDCYARILAYSLARLDLRDDAHKAQQKDVIKRLLESNIEYGIGPLFTEELFLGSTVSGCDPVKIVLEVVEEATERQSMRQLMKICFIKKIDATSVLREKLLKNHEDIDAVLDTVFVADLYLEKPELAIKPLEKKYLDMGFSQTFCDFVRTNNIDMYAFCDHDVYHKDLDLAAELGLDLIQMTLEDLYEDAQIGEYEWPHDENYELEGMNYDGFDDYYHEHSHFENMLYEDDFYSDDDSDMEYYL